MVAARSRNRNIYKAFGLHMASELSLPELPVAVEHISEVEVLIEYADLSAMFAELDRHNFMVQDGSIFFRIPHVAVFAVEGGRRIHVMPLPKSDEQVIRMYVLGTCMGGLLLQRGILPLHGSAVAIDGKAYAFVGESGAGKSTLAAAFIHKGHPLLSDDVIAVCHAPFDLGPIIHPAYPQQKLGKESLLHMDMEADQYELIPGERAKLHVPVASSFSAEPHPLAGIFELFAADNNEPVLHQFKGLERLRILMLHTYRNFLIPLLGMEQWHFSNAAQLACQIDVYQLRRPATGFTALLLADQIVERIREGELEHAR